MEKGDSRAIIHAIVDVIAIAACTVLAAIFKEATLAYFAITVAAAIAGVRVGNLFGSGKIPPSATALVATIVTGIAGAIAKVKGQ